VRNRITRQDGSVMEMFFNTKRNEGNKTDRKRKKNKINEWEDKKR
jgi:hypothetical protein